MLGKFHVWTQFMQQLTVASLKAKAQAEVGLNDFGPEQFEESLKRLLDSLSNEARVNSAGWRLLEDRFIDSLCGRLRIQDAITGHPAILDIPVEPVVIMGMNRTGTTKLHRLMATNPVFRTLPLWEAYFPCPLEGEGPHEHEIRLARTKAIVDAFKNAFPQAHAAHPIFAEVEEEETYSNQMQLQWTSWFGYGHIPSYMNWVIHSDMKPAYRWFKKTLQYMQWQNGGQDKKWLLKAPFHLGFLDDLFNVFPQAKVIHCHRFPLVDPVASITKLITNGHAFYSDDVDVKRIGKSTCGYLAASMKRNFEQRERYLPKIYDVNYLDTFNRSDALLAEIYDWLDEPFGDVEKQLVAQWEEDNPQHRHGKFEYSPEEAGLTEPQVEEEFEPYASWLRQFTDN
jgi:Sulfotransferase family